MACLLLGKQGFCREKDLSTDSTPLAVLGEEVGEGSSVVGVDR